MAEAEEDRQVAHRRLSVAFQPEIYHIIQTLKRLNQSSRFFSDDSTLTDLIQIFNELRRRMRQPPSLDLEPLSFQDCLQPFITLLRTPTINGQLVGAVLSSVAKFLRGDVFRRLGASQRDPQLPLRSFRALVVALAKLKYNENEINADEAVLQRLLDVLLLVLKSPLASQALGDADVCLLIECLFSLCVLPRPGELFRKQAELSCVELGGIVFSHLESPINEGFDTEIPNRNGGELLKIGYPGTRADEPAPLPPALAALEAEIEKVEAQQLAQRRPQQQGDGDSGRPSPAPSILISSGATSADATNKTSITYPIDEMKVVLPYGLPTIIAFLEHILWLLEVSEKRNTDRMRCLCLVIIGDLLEAHSERLPNVSVVWKFISTRLAKVLLQLMNQESTVLAPYLHQTLLGLFSRYRTTMVAQFEMFITSSLTLLNLKPVPGKSLKMSKEYYLELLLHFCLDPAFLRDLYLYYECGTRFGYVLSDLITSLAATAMSDPRQSNSPQDHSYLLALEIILTLLKTFNALGMPIDAPSDSIDPISLRQERQRKKLIVQSAHLFNGNPKEAFAFLLEHKLIQSSNDPKEIAHYLRRTPGLDKKAVGELISKPSNIEMLKEYLADFHFAGLEIDEALRSVLESFRLPGEAQQISRIMEVFAQIYYRDANQRGIFRNEDAVFVLAYSIVMLNTDQHNRQVRHRMSIEEFIRNNRGINNGSNFDEEFLRRIYDAIRNQEIVMPEEQGVEAAFNFAWNEQLKKNSTIPIGAESLLPPPIEALAGDVLLVAWKPILDCFRTLILSPRTDSTTRAAMRGLGELGGVVEHFLSPKEMNELITVLVETMAFPEIANNPAGNQLPRYLARSELFRQLIKCFFEQYRVHASKVREWGWMVFVEHALMLVEATVVSLATFEVEVTTSPTSGGMGEEERKRLASGNAPSAKSESSLFSTLSSYWTLGSNVNSNPNAQFEAKGIDSESRAKAIEFLRSCKLPEILRESRFLEEASLVALITAMLTALQVDFHKSSPNPSTPGGSATTPTTTTTTFTPSTPPGASTSLDHGRERGRKWDADTLVFLADLIIHTAWNNRDRMSLFWMPLFDRFSLIAKDLGAPAALREHCILGIGRLSLRFAEQPDMQKEVVQFFQLLCYLPPEAFQNIAESALSIVIRIVEMDPPILHGIAIWPHYFSVLALAGRSKSCGPYSFGLLTTIVREEEGILFPLDFYSEYVDLLNGFVASINVIGKSSSGGNVELAAQALHKFPLLEAHVRRHHARPSQLLQLWNDYVIPVHCAIAQQCYHPLREIRNLALSLLQRTLLSIDFEDGQLVKDEFRLVLLPLLEELQRPEMRNLDGNGVAEIQVRAAGVVSKVFLANLPLLFNNKDKVDLAMESDREAGNKGLLEGARELWLDIQNLLLRFLELPSMGKAADQLLKESIPETIKNMLLVMASSGVLRPASTLETTNNEERALLWKETWEKLDFILPGAQAEIIRLSDPSNLSDRPGAIEKDQEVPPPPPVIRPESPIIIEQDDDHDSDDNGDGDEDAPTSSESELVSASLPSILPLPLPLPASPSSPSASTELPLPDSTGAMDV